jgi:type I restriction enzyme R subunit
MDDFLKKIVVARDTYLDLGGGGTEDARLERVVYGRFRDEETREIFFELFREVESLYEILSPSPELRDHIATFKRLATLYAAVRNAYSRQLGYTADLAHKTRTLIQESADHSGLERFSKSVTFDSKTLEGLRRDDGPDEGKVFNLVRGLTKETEEHPEEAAVLQTLRDRAERVLKSMMDGLTSAQAAMTELERLATEKEDAERAARESGLLPQAFGVFFALKDDAALAEAGIDPMQVAREAESLTARYPDAAVNAEQQRLFRMGLYQPLLKLAPDDLKRIVERAMLVLFRG